MNIRQPALLVLGVLLLSSFLGATFAQEADTPDAAITGFYDWYLGYITGAEAFRSPLADGAYRDSEYLTQGLIERIDDRLANAGDMGLGYDLLLCAQDLPARHEFEVIRVQAGEALALLREYFGSPRSNNVTVTLNNAEGAWKIDDVTCGDTLTPRGVTEDFYTWYLGQWHQLRDSGAEGNLLTEGAYREYPFFTESLVATVDEEIASQEMGGGDPLLCAQDIPQSFGAYAVDREGNEATVLVQAFFQGNTTPHNLTVTLESTDDQWRISAITCGVAPETMANLLYQQYVDQVRYNLDNNIDMDILRNPMLHWNRNVNPELLARLVAETEGELIADPVLCAQDIPERFETELIDASDTTATVQIRGEYPSGPDTYTSYLLTVVTMELTEGQWMLTDIACAQ